MTITVDSDKLWAMVRELNEKSYLYSEMADKLTKLIQKLEGETL